MEFQESGGGASPDAPDDRRESASEDAVEARVARIEERLDTLVNVLLDKPIDAVEPPAAPTARAAERGARSSGEGDDPFWALTGLRERSQGTGAVLYTGTVDSGAGRIEYQWSRPTEEILSRDWDRAAGRLAALGHPVRLEMLRLLLAGERTVAEIVDELDLGSSGVAYHHLQQLEAAGWVHTTTRGRRDIPPSRVVALLTAILSTEEG